MDINYSELIIFFFFVILSAFFSSTETAFTAINRIRLKQWFEKEDVKHADKLEALIQSPSKLITAILIGNNFSNVVHVQRWPQPLLLIFYINLVLQIYYLLCPLSQYQLPYFFWFLVKLPQKHWP